MRQQTYPVACECGKEQAVTGGQAGSSLPCACGRTMEVPSLGALKRSVGQASISADLEIKHRLAEGSLPLEDDCVLCGAATRNVVMTRVVCEQAEKRDRIPWWYWLLIPIGLWVAVLVLVAYARGESRTLGRDVTFRLPVRVCDECDPGVWTLDAAREALLRSPLYARLLGKYPHAQVLPSAA